MLEKFEIKFYYCTKVTIFKNVYLFYDNINNKAINIHLYSMLKGCLYTEPLLDNTLESLALCFLQRHKGTGDFAESLCT